MKYLRIFYACAYIRIGIGAALRMQSGKPVEVRVLLRTRNMVPSNKWSVRRPFKPEMSGSSPTGITKEIYGWITRNW